MKEQLGERLIRAAAAGDFAEARSLLAADLHFRALTPHALREEHTREAAMRILEDWFAPTDAIESLSADTVVDRPAVRYRIRWSSAEEGPFVFEQQVYYDVVDGLITGIDLICSGDRRVPPQAVGAAAGAALDSER